MIILYGLFIFMTLGALSVLAVPFVIANKNNKIIFTKNFMIISLLMVTLAFGIYQIIGNQRALQSWFAYGKEHYQLQETVEALGGVPGMIAQIKMKLQANPEDAQGWLILGKLYLAEQEIALAKEALTKAHQLQPDDNEINRYYQQMNN